MLTADFEMHGSGFRMLDSDKTMLGAGFDMLDSEIASRRPGQEGLVFFLAHLLSAAVLARFLRFTAANCGMKFFRNPEIESNCSERSNGLLHHKFHSASNSSSVGCFQSFVAKLTRAHSRKILIRSSGRFLGSSKRNACSSVMGY